MDAPAMPEFGERLVMTGIKDGVPDDELLELEDDELEDEEELLEDEELLEEEDEPDAHRIQLPVTPMTSEVL